MENAWKGAKYHHGKTSVGLGCLLPYSPSKLSLLILQMCYFPIQKICMYHHILLISLNLHNSILPTTEAFRKTHSFIFWNLAPVSHLQCGCFLSSGNVKALARSGHVIHTIRLWNTTWEEGKKPSPKWVFIYYPYCARFCKLRSLLGLWPWKVLYKQSTIGN